MENKTLQIINAGGMNILEMKALLIGMNIVDIAEFFEKLDREKSIELFRILPKSIADDVFAYLESDQQKILIEALTDMEIGEIMNRLFVDDAVDFIEEMPANVVKRILQNVTPEKRNIINQFLQYGDDSAGSIMTTEYVDLKENATVSKAFENIRNTGIDKETIYTCYVISQDRMLKGIVTAKTLMLANPNDRIGDIMDTNLIFSYTTDDQETVAGQFQKYSLIAMPVVDKENRLVGIITVDDIVQVIVEESTEDIEKMAALAPSDEPYIKTSIVRLAQNRIVWLMVLMLSATITGSVIAGFEDGLAVMPILMAFIPMLMDTGGNAGAQSSTLVIRGMAVGEVRLRDVITVLWKEIGTGTLCGIALGTVNFFRVYFMHGRNLMLSLTVTAALFCTVLMAKMVGGLLPFAAKRMKIDPAIMAAPLITTIVDAVVLMIYFSIAKVVFGL